MTDQLSDEQIAEQLARLGKARQLVRALCAPRGSVGSREWTMSIPGRPDYDPDLVIDSALSFGETALLALQQARRERDQARTLRQAAERYFNGYVQDEADDAENCVTEQQHLDAIALRDALKGGE